MVNQQLGTNTFTTAKWIVSTDPSAGTHTTIGAAITSASSGDTIFIRSGTYTENPVLKAGVNLVAFNTSDAIILGKCSFSGTGQVVLSGLTLRTNGDFAVEVVGSAASDLGLVDCDLQGVANTTLSFTSSSASSSITAYDCSFDLSTTGITTYSKSSPGALNFRYSFLANTGASSTASTCSAGTLSMIDCYCQTPLNYSSSASSGTFGTFFDLNGSGLNATAITTSGTGSLNCLECQFNSGTASAINIGTGTVVTVANAVVTSSNTNAITGGGTIQYGSITFTGTSSTINTTTQIRLITKPSMSVVNQVFTSGGTYTPTTGMVSCSIQCLGGGGAGGGSPVTSVSQCSNGAGGGAGEYATGVFSAATISASQTITIGTAGVGASGTTGGNGGNTSVGAVITANGGTGGASGAAGAVAAAAPGAGGTGGTGGSFRTPGMISAFSWGTFAGGVILGSSGANSQFGSGGVNTFQATGTAAAGFGAGGGGTANGQSQAARTGGAGTSGIVYITEYVIN